MVGWCWIAMVGGLDCNGRWTLILGGCSSSFFFFFLLFLDVGERERERVARKKKVIITM